MRFHTKLGFAVAILMFVAGCAQHHVHSDAAVAPSMRHQHQPQPEQARASERLGTQWGEGISSNITTVDLQRVSSQPVDLVEIYYSATRYMGNAIQEAMIANGRIGMSVLSESGRKWELTKDGSRLYLRGQDGERYQLFYQNYSQNTYEIVATVDGLDVMDGSAG
ncbi:MAG: hypothetical protein FWH56_13095, partial [Betaproteobacteria bacterium]|nr:hypothetical protein [Betaproteobacteria bacterium]